MKNILYISKFTGSQKINDALQSMSSIWQHAKKANAPQEITGVLVYKNQYFLQILEGPDKNIDTLMEKIKQDSRHTDLAVLFESPTTERTFAEWNMRLLASCSDIKLIDFISEKVQNTAGIPKEHKTLLENFYNFSTHENMKTDLRNFSNFHIKLLVWPNFNNIKPSVALIDLCSLLINSYQYYSELLLQHSFSSKKELDITLNYLYTLGVLDLRQSKRKQNAQKKQNMPIIENSFYEKMKLFLTKEI